MPDEADDRVRKALSRISGNFAALGDRFAVVGQQVGEMGKSMTRSLNRIAGAQAAQRDWGAKLWPEDEEEETDD